MTRKMRLDPDQLTVESFATAAGASTIGTVHGQASGFASCPGNDTCDAGVQTCYESCACATRYPDYCPKDTFQLVNSCIQTCNTCHVTCRTCTCLTCFC